MSNQMYSMLNLAWNMAEYMASQHRYEDILWLYTGMVFDSMEFNIIEYILDRFGLIK